MIVTKWAAVLHDDYGQKDLEVECFSVQVIETAKQFRLVDCRAQAALRYRRVFFERLSMPAA